MDLIKQVVAIDVAAEELVCTFGMINIDLEIRIKPTIAFSNSLKGFKELEKWINQLITPNIKLEFICEATGVYHQKLAYWLFNNKYKVAIVLPNKIAFYTKALNQKTITDSCSADIICRFGLIHNLDYWQPPHPIFNKLKQLTRERDQIVKEINVTQNQLHSDKKEQDPHKQSIKRLEARCKLLKKQEKEIDKEITALINSDSTIKERVKRIQSIPGLGILTVAIIFAETNGFELIRNKKQITSYAGLDIVQKQSGTSVNRKTRISKKGNVYLRKALYFPAISAVSCNKVHRDIKERISLKSGLKMKGYVCIQRKLLELAYILDKTETYYDKEYESKKKTPQIAEPSQSSLC